jgi:hypothetical protein
MVSRRARGLLEGAIDLHVHVKPASRGRLADSRELIAAAGAAGMRAVLFKDHDRCTIADAYHARALRKDVEAIGAVCLNAPVGGLNPAAAEAALHMGAKAVFLPTDSALNNQRFLTSHANEFAPRAGSAGNVERKYPMSIDALDTHRRLRPEVIQVIDLCAQWDAMVCTGHLGADEVSVIVAECASRGARVLVTHAMLFNDATAKSLAEWAAAGALLELVAVSCCGHVPACLSRTFAMEAELIELLGDAVFVLSSDLGQLGNPAPAEGLGLFIEGLLGEGISEGQIERMVRTNPARVVGL